MKDLWTTSITPNGRLKIGDFATNGLEWWLHDPYKETKRYKLIFHFMSGDTYEATKVKEYKFGSNPFVLYSQKSWDGTDFIYTRIKNKFTVEDVTIPLHDCIAIEIWDNDSGEVVVKRNPQFDVVVDVDVTTNRRKIKRNNRLHNDKKCGRIGSCEDESDNHVKNSGEGVSGESITSYLGN